MDAIVRSPGSSPYSKAREALIRHFGKTPRQLAREFRDARSLGDRLPSEFLDYLLGLIPDFMTVVEVALLDALPVNARVAALQHKDVRSMALAADAVVLETRASSEASLPSVNSLSLLDDDVAPSPMVHQMPPPLIPQVAAVQHKKPRKSDGLCSNHARWGKETYKCLSPNSCKMRSVLKPPPSRPSASGNGKAAAAALTSCVNHS